jgi:hypothetical protein
VSEPADKHTDSKGTARANQLPNPELNPLMNPILGQNLGRWAQVYFTNPPEKREQAVTALLRELERQSPEVVAAHKFGAENSVEDSRVRHEVVCPSCRRRNEVAHKFCGFCGSSLQVEAPASVQSTQKDRTTNFAPVQPRPVAPHSTLGEVQWLREKALRSADQPEPQTRPKWKFWVAGLVIVLAGFGYLRWTSVRQAPKSTHAAKASTERAQPAVSPVQAIPVALPVDPRGPAQLSQQSPAATDGSEELRLAQRYLKGNGPARDSTEAAQWLWKAVAKHNTNAILLLADLYMRGDGLSKSCDQARLLLVAAAEKGSAEAHEKLRNLASNGCP